jgi:LuxR family quorum-sensing system transcriptional regulator CciR
VSGKAATDEFIHNARRVTSMRELASLLADATRIIGFDFYALNHHCALCAPDASPSSSRRAGIVALSNYPPHWIGVYVSERLMDDDPLIRASEASPVGFRWDDLDEIIPGTRRHPLFERAGRVADIGTGCTIPVNFPGQPPASAHFAVRVGRAFPSGGLEAAEIVGRVGFHAARTLARNRHSDASRTAGPNLTGRQLECILLFGKGRTEQQIGALLGISRETVKQHLKGARTAYEVSKTIQLVTRAIYSGEIRIGDLLRP